MCATGSRVFGYTKQGLPCKNCIKQKRYCHQHRDQEPRGTPAPVQQQRPYPRAPPSPPFCVAATSSDEATMQHINHDNQDSFCPPCDQLGRDCSYHAYKKNPNYLYGRGWTPAETAFYREDRLQREVQPQTRSSTAAGAQDFGIAASTGKPCKLCLLKGDFCKKHESQRPRNGATVLTQERVQSAPSSSTRQQPLIVYGVKTNGKPCKICIYRGDFCNWHEHQRNSSVLLSPEERAQTAASTEQASFGTTLAGNPCQICIREGDYCHFHLDQRPVQEPAVTIESNSPSLTRRGTPCKLCIRKGSDCHIHATKKTPKVSVLGRIRSFLSLVLFGVIFHYAVFVVLLETTTMQRLQHQAIDIYQEIPEIPLDLIMEKGSQAYKALGLEALVERGLELKDAVIQRDWVQDRPSFVQALMETGHGEKVPCDAERYHPDLMIFMQSNATSGAFSHGDISVGLN